MKFVGVYSLPTVTVIFYAILIQPNGLFHQNNTTHSKQDITQKYGTYMQAHKEKKRGLGCRWADLGVGIFFHLEKKIRNRLVTSRLLFADRAHTDRQTNKHKQTAETYIVAFTA